MEDGAIVQITLSLVPMLLVMIYQKPFYCIGAIILYQIWSYHWRQVLSQDGYQFLYFDYLGLSELAYTHCLWLSFFFQV